MGKLTLTTFVSLDGVMQAPGAPDEDRSGAFQQGGWLVPYADADFAQFVDGWLAAADAFLLGRTTYELFAGYWPRVTDRADPVASRLNSLPKHVVSKTLGRVDWHNSTLVRGDVVKEIAALKGDYKRELQVHGSCGLAQTLMQHDLIDEYRLWLFPVVLGSGKRLFGQGVTPAALKLVASKTTGSGITVNTYRPAGKPTYGSFALES